MHGTAQFLRQLLPANIAMMHINNRKPLALDHCETPGSFLNRSQGAKVELSAHCEYDIKLETSSDEIDRLKLYSCVHNCSTILKKYIS